MARGPMQIECQVREGIVTRAYPIVKLSQVDVVNFRREQRSVWSLSRWRPDDGFVLEAANAPDLWERSDLTVFWEPGSEVVVDRVAGFETHRGDKASVFSGVWAPDWNSRCWGRSRVPAAVSRSHA